ncbi:predicted protein SypD [Vibrio ponticus]|nr:predicted protein SypD [Vibrio ponticus]
MIPATLNEIEQIFLAAEAKQARSLCVTSSHSGDGVTSTATALAERFLLAGFSTLLVDLNLFKPGYDVISQFDNTDKQSEPKSIQWLQPKLGEQLFTGITLPNHPTVMVNFRNPNYLKQQIENWLEQFDRVVIDTSPLLQNNRGNIPAQSVANACQYTVLVVLGGETSQGSLLASHELLQRAEAKVLGVVLNNMTQRSLGEEIVRELNRCQFIPSKLRHKLTKRLLNNEWLSHIA